MSGKMCLLNPPLWLWQTSRRLSDVHARTTQTSLGTSSITASNVEKLKVNLGAKVKVNSRLGIAGLLAKEVGARGCLPLAPTPVDKWVKSLIYKKVGVGARGAACSCVHLAPTPT